MFLNNQRYNEVVNFFCVDSKDGVLGRIMYWLLVLCPILVGFSAQASREIPNLPANTLVFDETGQLNSKELQPLKDLLSEHQRLTDQKIVFAIFSPIGDEKEQKWAKGVFEKWKLNTPIKGDSFLLSLFWQTQTARTEFGFGLDSLLNAEETESAIQECLKKRNLKLYPTKSLFCAAYKVLELLNSPLIESGKAAEIAQGSDIPEPLNPTGETELPWGSILVLTAGTLILLLTLGKIFLRGRSLKETKFGFLVFWQKQTPMNFIPKESDDKHNSFEDEFEP
jgi:hypothetical protein